MRDDFIDRKIRKMAEAERMAVPESLDAKVENILDGLETEKKDSKNTDGKRVNQTVRHYGFRRIVIPAAACLLLASVTVTASGLYRARMESMNHEKLETYFSGLQEADVAADSYSRPLTDGEKNRLEELRQAYLEEGYFPKKELVMLDSPEKYKKGVAFYAARSIFFLPEEEMTDEELLELIDFREKRDYSLAKITEEIGLEASNVFQALSKGEVVEHTRHLLVAPKCLQNKVLDMLDEEIAHARNGEEAYAGFKLNSLTDKKIIDKLIEASEAGVKIDMIIRGICCLIPGVEGKTENIRIISIVGRFLEHSRIYIFGSKERRKYYIASADFMTRNTVRRVEVAAPVYNDKLKTKLQEMFDVMLSDNQKARKLEVDGNYHRVSNDLTPVNAQEYFYAEAYHEIP